MSSTDPLDQAVSALREAVALDAVPAEVVAAARSAYTWRTIDAELAALSFDSLDTGELVGTRGGDGARALSFEYGSVSIEVDATFGDGGGVVLDGQVAPGVPSSIEVHHVDHVEPIDAAIRANGRFEAIDVPTGAIRLMVRFASGTGPAMLLTEWVNV